MNKENIIDDLFVLIEYYRQINISDYGDGVIDGLLLAIKHIECYEN